MKKTIIITLITAIFLSGCSYFDKNKDDDLLERGTPIAPKSVEIFDLGNEKPQITFKTGGTITSFGENTVTPEIAGKITQIHAKVGDKVKKGDLLVTLGDSLNTDVLNIQYDTALKSLNLNLYSQYYTEYAAEIGIENASVQLKIAEENYYAALHSRNNAEAQFEVQYETSEVQIENAYRNLDKARDAYYKASQITETTPEQLSQLKAAIEQAQIALEQIQLGQDGTEVGFFTQEDQLNYSIEVAYLQCIAALNQLESTKAQAELQRIQAQAQILQAESTATIAVLGNDRKQIRASISGTVTEIAIKEGTIVSPGQPLLQVQDTNALMAKTALSQEEAKFVKIGDKVEVEVEGKTLESKVKSISPALNKLTKKIDVEVQIIETANVLPGSFAKANFKPSTNGKIFVPLNTVFLDEDKKYVRIVNDEEKVEFKYITVGQIIGNYIEVAAGLDGDEEVIKSVNTFLKQDEKLVLHK